MNKQENYVPPGVEVCHVRVEGSIAAGTPVKTASANIPDSWLTEGDGIYGNQSATEGGVVFMSW